mmetsp:Transcript_23936/g.56698  ORF Transcript_23936/g.56698 Transcript_23936/m.56698 type:complete len:272 (+) Transcript_23936:313-1128(+)
MPHITNAVTRFQEPFSFFSAFAESFFFSPSFSPSLFSPSCSFGFCPAATSVSGSSPALCARVAASELAERARIVRWPSSCVRDALGSLSNFFSKTSFICTRSKPANLDWSTASLSSRSFSSSVFGSEPMTMAPPGASFGSLSGKRALSSASSCFTSLISPAFFCRFAAFMAACLAASCAAASSFSAAARFSGVTVMFIARSVAVVSSTLSCATLSSRVALVTASSAASATSGGVPGPRSSLANLASFTFSAFACSSFSASCTAFAAASLAA